MSPMMIDLIETLPPAIVLFAIAYFIFRKKLKTTAFAIMFLAIWMLCAIVLPVLVKPKTPPPPPAAVNQEPAPQKDIFDQLAEQQKAGKR